jgi:hypothetical protein
VVALLLLWKGGSSGREHRSVDSTVSRVPDAVDLAGPGMGGQWRRPHHHRPVTTYMIDNKVPLLQGVENPFAVGGLVGSLSMPEPASSASPPAGG